MRTLALLLLASVSLAQERVWVKPTYTEFFYGNARVREPEEHPAHAALRDAWSMLAAEKRAKEANGGHLPAGYKVYRGGWWYTADGRGGDTFCAECNGMTEAEAREWVKADRAKRAPEVPAQPVFRGPAYHGDHTCPNCRHTSASGTGTWVVRGQAGDGTHVHTCPRCNTSWKH
jgi:hypothetical protein